MLRRIPGKDEIVPVLAIIALVVYSWTILWFFWKLGSWLHFLTAGEILAVLGYALATNLLECLVVLLIPFSLAMVLPGRLFRDRFVAQATCLVLFMLGYLMIYVAQFRAQEDYPAAWIAWTPLIFLLALVASYFCARIRVLAVVAESLADRAVVLLYLLIPLSVLSLILVAIRNAL